VLWGVERTESTFVPRADVDGSRSSRLSLRSSSTKDIGASRPIERSSDGG
jgi:hypothetical protein